MIARSSVGSRCCARDWRDWSLFFGIELPGKREPQNAGSIAPYWTGAPWRADGRAPPLHGNVLVIDISPQDRDTTSGRLRQGTLTDRTRESTRGEREIATRRSHDQERASYQIDGIGPRIELHPRPCTKECGTSRQDSSIERRSTKGHCVHE